MKLCIVRDPALGIDFGYINKLLPYLSKNMNIVIYDKLSYKTVKEINNLYDIVNIQYPIKILKNPILNHFYFLLLFRKIKIKKVITMHGFVTKQSNKFLGLFAPIYYGLLNSTKTIVFSELQKSVLNQYHVKNIVVIPHGCNDCDYNINDKKRDVIFFHGFIRKSKGIEILIKAVKKLIEEKYNLYLKILGNSYKGEESYVKIIKDLLEKEIPEHYELKIGIHTDEEITREASISYIAVLPYIDNFIEVSGVLHTIMACGTPVIVSNTPRFISELKNDYNACIVEPNENAIAEGIKKLITDYGYWKMLSENLQKKAVECRWEHIAQMLTEEFNKIK
ncbi:MAG: glycosyltransferase [Thermoplasmata archaeon]